MATEDGFARIRNQRVEGPAMVALGALEQLGVDPHRRLGVRVANLTHHILDVATGREQQHRDVRSTQCVGRDVGQWV